MNDLLSYSLRSAAVLALLLIPYLLLLRHERLFRLNRAVLLGILLLSLSVPLCHVPMPAMKWHTTHLDIQPPAAPAPASTEGSEPTVQPASQPDPDMAASAAAGLPWTVVLGWACLAGMAATGAVRLMQVARMRGAIRCGCLWTLRENGCTVYCHAEDVAPFSWMRSIVIGEADYRMHGRPIILHEQGHILHCHSLDVLLLAAVETLQWWNPLVYVLGNCLRDVHEYQADDHALRRGVGLREYQMLLVRKVAGSGTCALANSFNHSLIQKRISMMMKSNPRKRARAKALYLVPLVALALSAFATPETAGQTSGSAVLATAPADSVPMVTFKPRERMGRKVADAYVVHFPLNTWIENVGQGSYLSDCATHMAFEATQTSLQLDGATFGRSSLPRLPAAAVRKVEIRRNARKNHMWVNIITREVKVPASVRPTILPVVTVMLPGRNEIGFAQGTAAAQKSNWMNVSATAWDTDRFGNKGIRKELETRRGHPDFKVYIYASTEATQQEIGRMEGILKAQGISNYTVVRDLTIVHPSADEFRQWALAEKQKGTRYDQLYNLMAQKHAGCDDIRKHWHVVKAVYGRK